jgi:voltage-gated sodium channel
VTIVLAASFLLKLPELIILLSFVCLKSFRTLDFLPKTRHIIDAFTRTLPGVFNVLLMIILAYVIFGALATHLFGAHVPSLWGDFMTSFLSLQQAMLGDDWGNNLRATMKFYPHAWVFLAIFLFVVSMILLNLFVGIIVDSMQSVEEKSDKSDDDDSLISKQEFEALRRDIEEIKVLLKKPKK